MKISQRMVVACTLAILFVPAFGQQKQGRSSSAGRIYIPHGIKIQKLGPAAQAKRKGAMQVPEAAAQANYYVVMLINSTDFHVRVARVNGGAWFPTQDIGRTCNSTDYDTCFNQQAYRPLLTAGCGDTIQITVGWPNGSGGYDGAEFQPFKTDCTYAGGVIQLIP